MTVRKNTNTQSFGDRAARIMMLERAKGHLKSGPLAEAMGIGVRALQHKLDAGRGITDTDLSLAAAALERQVAEIETVLRQIREAIA